MLEADAEEATGPGSVGFAPLLAFHNSQVHVVILRTGHQ